MTYSVHELPKAQTDIRCIFEWIRGHSPEGADAWLDAYDSLVERLRQDAAAFGEAYEKQYLEFDVRQVLFKTRRARVYRALFFIDGEDVYILRVRGPGQAPVAPVDID
jgi:plasmid stabilization system protein ParE